MLTFISNKANPKSTTSRPATAWSHRVECIDASRAQSTRLALGAPAILGFSIEIGDDPIHQTEQGEGFLDIEAGPRRAVCRSGTFEQTMPQSPPRRRQEHLDVPTVFRTSPTDDEAPLVERPDRLRR